MKLTISFYSASEPVKIVQILLFKMSWGTHVQIGESESALDMSAEPSGVKWVLRSDKNLIARYSIEVPGLTPRKWHQICKKYLGKKYDYPMYISWFLRMSWVYAIIILGFLTALQVLPFKTAFLSAWIWVVFSRIAGYITTRMSRGRYQCAEVTCSSLFDVGIDMLIKIFDASTPDMLLDRIEFTLKGYKFIKEK